MTHNDIVWTTETEKGLVVKVNKKVLPARDNLPEKTTFQVNVGRKRSTGEGTMPLFLLRGENADDLVVGLERAVASALIEAERLFKEALPPRPQSNKPNTSYKPRKEAYSRVGTHGKKKADAPKDGDTGA